MLADECCMVHPLPTTAANQPTNQQLQTNQQTTNRPPPSPHRWNHDSTMMPSRLPRCRLSAVGSNPQ